MQRYAAYKFSWPPGIALPGFGPQKGHALPGFEIQKGHAQKGHTKKDLHYCNLCFNITHEYIFIHVLYFIGGFIMRTIELEVMKFEELSDSAKDNARDWFRQGKSYFWWEDSLKSIEKFCSEFGVKIRDYEVGTSRHSYMDTNADNSHFRGLKFKDFKRNDTPTGYMLDCTLRETFYDTWKDTGSALKAFNEAIDASIKDIVNDMEYQDSEEAVDEMLIVNGYEFYPNGKIYH